MDKVAIAHAFRNMLATIGAGVFLVGGFFIFSGVQHMIGRWEVDRWPVLATVTVCEGVRAAETGTCSGPVVVYEGFQQTAARCDGRDAIVSGTLSKVRTDASYIDGRQQIFYGEPNGRFRSTFFEFMDQQPGVPTNRPLGVQEWGPWRLIGGCITGYATWFTTVEHRAWHGFWPLPTTAGPFPLPRAKVVG